jgi:hypothetical protein
MPKDDAPFLARLRTALLVRAVCRADDDAGAAAALAGLPPLEGDLPAPRPAGIVLTSCDDGYFRRYGRHLARSVLRRSPDQACHLHLVDPTPASLALLRELAAEGAFSFSSERLAAAAAPVRTTLGRYIICSRFARVHQLLAATGSPVLMLDADSLVRLPLTPLLAGLGGCDAALFLRPGSRDPCRRVLGAALAVMPTDLGRRFARDCATALALAIRQGPHLAADQLVLYRAWRWYRRIRPAFRCAALAREHSDWRYGEASPVWHAKGKRKRTLAAVFGRLEAGVALDEALGAAPPAGAGPR